MEEWGGGSELGLDSYASPKTSIAWPDGCRGFVLLEAIPGITLCVYPVV